MTAGSTSKSVTMDGATYSDVDGAGQAGPGGQAMGSRPGGTLGPDPNAGARDTQQPLAG